MAQTLKLYYLLFLGQKTKKKYIKNTNLAIIFIQIIYVILFLVH